ncbi:uncharacterized protein LOC121248205 [Juglans microcarpa x Juglans regia]|uniref:uncharacterized protein LOC121248205 n=1 Tax=Juglans microcarpa x Juglans regia TaxID=2249226 RepID=UPI001B7D913C|nr:uncharacterized protein LOC121248205 [Juglans microcarpa x Juglans regia]
MVRVSLFGLIYGVATSVYEIPSLPSLLLLESNGAPQWNVDFIRAAHDWELESFTEFFAALYSTSIQRGSRDKMLWNLSKKGTFSVSSFYHKLTNPGLSMFLWKSIWKTKAPSKAAFFVWTASLDKILTTDNLRKRQVVVLDWCCMRKKHEESVDHLLLHCEVVKVIWDDVFLRVKLSWVMPCRLVDFLASWRGLHGDSQVAAIWRLVPICLCWCVWSERNARCFDDHERTLSELKAFFFKSLFLWAGAIVCNGSSVHDLLLSIVTSS